MPRRPAAAFLVLSLSFAGVFTAAGTVRAQETREAALDGQRAERAKSLRAYEPGKVERWMLWFEEADPLGKIAPYDGFYLQYGFRWKPVGGGLGARRRLAP